LKLISELKIQNGEISVYINNERQMEKVKNLENKILRYKNESSFTPFNRDLATILLLNKQVNELDSTIVVRTKDIETSELQDPPNYVSPRQGSRGKIRKKIYKSLEVACKPTYLDNNQQTQKHLAILEKLGLCPYIIKFLGLSEIDTEKVMVFEWAEFGTLRDVYQNYKIDWEAKVYIARDICRGLAFLNNAAILHHDIRCENVLINENIQPKLTNFKFSREFHATTTRIDDTSALIRWLAPEKLSYVSTKYTIQCEIFSFGMLLWELAFQKIPYEGKSVLEIQSHVLEGNRETLDFGGLSPHSVQREFGEIIKLAWHQDPSSRPEIQLLFNMLQELYEYYVLNKSSQVVEDEFFKKLNISVTPLIPVKEGLQAHKDGNYKKAWECFEANANVGDILAIHWQGYYYLEGIHVSKNKQKAMELFRKAADAGNADAQLRYAFCLIDKKNNQVDINNFMRYLKMSADNNNATALYNLGDVYFSGKLGIEKDKEKGINYLKQAALNKQARAKEILDKNNINIHD
jgi:serine/threonine protein kinase